MRSTLLCLLIAAAASWAVIRHLPEEEAHAQAIISNRVQAGVVRGVAIDGQELPLAQLRALVGTRPGAGLDTQQLAIDRDAITGLLVARGYLAAKVAPPSVTYGGDGVYVVFDVEKGPLYRVRTVTVTGPGEREALMTLLPGDDANADRISRARQMLAESIERRTRGKVGVELTVRPDPATASVDVELATRVTTITKSTITLIR